MPEESALLPSRSVSEVRLLNQPGIALLTLSRSGSSIHTPLKVAAEGLSSLAGSNARRRGGMRNRFRTWRRGTSLSSLTATAAIVPCVLAPLVMRRLYKLRKYVK